MTRTIDLGDYLWLLGDHAGRLLDRLAEDDRPLAAQAKALRRDLSADRVHLLLEQAELRRRARAKFHAAHRMFFTAVGLEQATDETLAAYKASRFQAGQPGADLCCGIGGDLLGLAGRGPVVGVDRDPVHALLAQANAQATPAAAGRAQVRQEEAQRVRVTDFAAWHIDPDRRPQGRRTTHVGLHEPGADVIERLFVANPNAAVKLAPAAEVPDRWERAGELEWISRARECRQLVVWFGPLAVEPGRRRATRVEATQTHTFVSEPGGSAPPAPRAGRYVYEPDPAVLAAGLAAALANRHGLAGLGPQPGYLTGDAPLDEPLLACFAVREVLPLDLKRLRSALASRGIGRLEIKKRGVGDGPEVLRRRLGPRGPNAAVLILTRVAGRAVAMIADRDSGSERP